MRATADCVCGSKFGPVQNLSAGKVADKVKLSDESIGNMNISNKNNMLLATDGIKYVTTAKKVNANEKKSKRTNE